MRSSPSSQRLSSGGSRLGMQCPSTRMTPLYPSSQRRSNGCTRLTRLRAHAQARKTANSRIITNKSQAKSCRRWTRAKKSHFSCRLSRTQTQLNGFIRRAASGTTRRTRMRVQMRNRSVLVGFKSRTLITRCSVSPSSRLKTSRASWSCPQTSSATQITTKLATTRQQQSTKHGRQTWANANQNHSCFNFPERPFRDPKCTRNHSWLAYRNTREKRTKVSAHRQAQMNYRLLKRKYR